MSKKRKEFLKKIILFSFFALIASIYLSNITRDIYSGDLGDLVTAANVFGVAHPPGYPLLTFSGGVLTHLPLPLPPVSKVALVSVISSLIALVLFYKFCFKETKNFFISLLSTSILALSYMFWLFTEIPEVFALNNLFIIALFYFAVRFYEKRKDKDLYIFSFLVGLSLTNQHQIILIYPAIFVLLLPAAKQYLKQPKKIGKSILALFLGLTPYLYVPISASRNPVVNWDNASNLTNFIHLVTRADYVTFTKGDLQLSERLPIIGVYFSSLVNNYSTLIVLISIIGILFLFRRNKLKLLSYISAFLISGPFFIFYIVTFIKDADALGVIERIFMESFIVFLLFLPYGFLFIRSFIKRLIPKKLDATIFLLVFLIVPFQMLFYNFNKNDLSKTTIGNDLSYNTLSLLPPNALILLHGDTNNFNTWYVHFVLGFRPDVTLIISKKTANDGFQQALYESYIKKNPGSKLTEEEVLSSQIPEIIKTRPFFTTFIVKTKDPNLIFLPKGIYYEIIEKKNVPNKKEFLSSLEKINKLHIPRRETLSLSEQNLITPEITKTYSNGTSAIGTFLNDYYNDPKLAKKYFERAVYIDNSNPVAYVKLGVTQLNAEKDCKKSIENIKKGIDIYPVYEPFYFTLRSVYSRCKVSQAVIGELDKRYQDLFRKKFEASPSAASTIPLQ